MGIILSIFISYVGIKETIECLKHIISGVVPNLDSNFNDLVEYYTRLHRQTANPSSSAPDWRNDCGQGYIAWTEDENGNLTAGAIKFHGKPSNSTALLFSTKISSFGQSYSVEDTPQENGDYRSDRHQLTKTKTIISDTSESFSVGSKNHSKSVTPNPSIDRDYNNDDNEQQNKLTWQYTPQSPTMLLPEIHFQSYDDEKRENITYSEDYLRSLDGIKFRPLQRSDPSGRRRSFRKRLSSSSNSSKESRESREEELKMFTSLEEAEFSSMNRENKGGFGSTPNLPGRSYSRSRSREKSKDSWDEKETYADNAFNDKRVEDAQSKALPKLSSLEETVANDKQEVNEEEDEVDFWANFGD